MVSFRHHDSISPYHILALNQHRSFRKAADSQNITHPAFSRSISQAEEILGVKLFDRNKNGAIPTIFGKLFLEQAPTLLRQRAELQREITLLQGIDTGEISIASGPFVADICSYTAAARLFAKHPKLNIDMVSCDWYQVKELVLSGKVDLGMAEISDAEHADIKIEMTGQHPFIFYCRTGHPLTILEIVTKRDFSSYPLVLTRFSHRFEELFPYRLRYDKQSGYLSPPVTVENIHLSRQFVMESDAISIATISQIKTEVENGAVQILPYWHNKMRTNHGFIYLSERTLAPAAVVYMEEVRRRERELTEEGKVLWEQFIPKRVATAASVYR